MTRTVPCGYVHHLCRVVALRIVPEQGGVGNGVSRLCSSAASEQCQSEAGEAGSFGVTQSDLRTHESPCPPRRVSPEARDEVLQCRRRASLAIVERKGAKPTAGLSRPAPSESEAARAPTLASGQPLDVSLRLFQSQPAVALAKFPNGLNLLPAVSQLMQMRRHLHSEVSFQAQVLQYEFDFPLQASKPARSRRAAPTRERAKGAGQLMPQA